MRRNLLSICAFLIVSLSVFTSCKNSFEEATATKANEADFTVKNGRIVFKDWQGYENTVKILVNQQGAFLDEWEKNLNFTSYRRSGFLESKDEIIPGYGFPRDLATLINAEGVYQISDSIFFYSNGYQYIIPNQNEELLLKVQRNEATDVFKFKLGVKFEEINLNNARVDLPAGQLDARYQHQYYPDWPYSGGEHGLVCEIANVVAGAAINSGYQARIVARIKKMYKDSRGRWQSGGEITEKRITNLSYSFTYRNNLGYITNFSGSNINVATQTDATNLEHTINDPTLSVGYQQSVSCEVSGNFYAKVLTDLHTQGYLNFLATW
jgi:hypothetical protein